MRSEAIPTLAVTSGEPAGIGPELCAALVGIGRPARIVILCDEGLLRERVGPGLARCVKSYQPDGPKLPGCLEVLHMPLRAPAVAGELDPANGKYVLDMLDRAIDGCVGGEFAAIVTAPVHKGVICDAGIPFTGHTEYLAARTGTSRVVMVLVGAGLRVALTTTHLPLREVADAITPERLTETLRILDAGLREQFRIRNPRVLVAGLNPHAGEHGHLGSEEIEVIEPVLERLRDEGMQLTGPLPADTLFVPHSLDRADAVLAMYHDQGLPVLKHASFGAGVNVTLGLPIVRTSVDHGTALDMAGSGRADPGSLMAAVELAIEMVQKRPQEA